MSEPKPDYANMTRHEWREATRDTRVSRHKASRGDWLPRAIRRAAPYLGKPGRRGRKARARINRVFGKYGVQRG